MVMENPKRTAVFSVAGKAYRVVTTATDEEIGRLSRIVDERVRGMAGARPVTLEAAVLAAISLAHDSELHRERADRVEQEARVAMARVLERIDSALGHQDEADQADGDG